MILNRSLAATNPARSQFSKDAFSVKVLRHDVDGFAVSQTFNVGSLSVNFNGALCTNQTAALTNTANLLLPSDLWFTLGAAVAVTGTIQGYDHQGNYREVQFSKSAAGTLFTLASSGVTIIKGSANICWSSITSCVLVNASAATNTTITIGTSYSTASNDLIPRIPLPMPAAATTELAAHVLLLGAGGGTFTVPAAVPGRCAITSLGGNGTSIVPTVTITGGSEPTSEMEFIVGYTPGLAASR